MLVGLATFLETAQQETTEVAIQTKNPYAIGAAIVLSIAGIAILTYTTVKNYWKGLDEIKNDLKKALLEQLRDKQTLSQLEEPVQFAY